MNKNMAVVTRADFDAALARIENGDTQKGDYNLVRAYVDRLEGVGMRIERGRPDPLPNELIADYETNTEAILYSELVREA